MDNIKNDLYYAKRLIKSIVVTSRYLNNKSQEDILTDGFLCDALENRFTKIAEDASHLSSSFKNTINTIPWFAINSIRNRICHDYDAVDNTILYKTIKVDFPLFKEELLNAVGFISMNLYPENFEKVINKTKKVEMRLFDEKRRKLKEGDIIIFQNTLSKAQAIAEITQLNTYRNFEELYAKYNKTVLGYSNTESASPNDMFQYYSKEDIEKYGALAIEIKIY